ncbi:Wadjet anti-phage system protein JetD domain-containing protein [Psychrobacillus sp. NPDC096426]|uniref:Wadjet anti-phage system protein JetD domain-containing protein n=1 Tax=Psychrobacillus sp. NPDC096426 TaxID=3364491 RepID=UPI0037F4043A
MDEALKQLAARKKMTISLDELSALFYKEGQTYEELATIILNLVNDSILQAVKSTGRTTRTPSVAYNYRIMKTVMKADHHGELHTYNQTFHNSIHLDAYYKLPADVFYKDLPFLKRLDTYIITNGLPKESVPAPERSAEIVGDEKWLDEKGGKELLERVQLWDLIKIIPVSDPLMMAVNPKTLQRAKQVHLIVENKTTYQALLAVLSDTIFSTLIYGCGNKIVKSIEQFDWQLPLPEVEHTFYYFGDIDKSGLTIWYSLHKKQQIKLAVPFYEACLKKQPFQGKLSQRKNEDATKSFLAELPQGAAIEKLLDAGFYYPQEILTSAELGSIWREWSWKVMNGKD